MAKQLTSAEFDKVITEAKVPVLVDFYADWCGPCKMMAPSVEAMEGIYGDKLKIGKLNVDDNPDIAEKYNVMSIPTLIFFEGGNAVQTSVGLISRSALQEKIDSVVHA